MMATDGVILTQSPEGIEAEFSYFTSDIRDVQNKTKRKSYFRTSEKSLLCLYSSKAEDEFMRYKPRNITRIVEPEKKYLCLEYGPDDAPMYMLLDFNDSRECMDEWYSALCQLIGLKNQIRERTKSETLIRRPSAGKTRRAVSTFQPVTTPIPEGPHKNDNSGGNLRLEDASNAEPQFSGTNTDSESSSQRTTDGTASDTDNVSMTDSGELSPFSSLKSDEGVELYRRENQLRLLQEERDKKFVDVKVSADELKRLTVSDYDGQVYASNVKDDAPPAIYIGDKLLEVDTKKISTADDTMNVIRNLENKETEVPVRLERFPRGNICVVGSDVSTLPELGITLEGSEITSAEGAFRRSCDPAWVPFKGERSTRSISAINDHPVPLQTTTQEVTELIKHALDDISIAVFHVHPTEFLKELASSSSTNL